MSVMPIGRLPFDLCKKIITFAVEITEDEELIPRLRVCKVFYAIINQVGWTMMMHKWHLSPVFTMRHLDKRVVMNVCQSYCSVAWQLFPTLQRPQFPIENPILLKTTIQRQCGLYQRGYVYSPHLELIVKAAVSSTDSIERVTQAFQVCFDSGLTTPLNIYWILSTAAAVTPPTRWITLDYVARYSLDIVDATALNALDYLKFNLFVAPIRDIFVSLCPLIKRMSDTEFESFLDGLGKKYCFTFKRDFVHFLFRTENQYIEGMNTLKDYYSQIRNNLSPALVFDTSHLHQEETKFSYEDSLETQYQELSKESNTLHLAFINELLDSISQIHETESGDSDEQKFAQFSNLLSTMITSFTEQQGLQLDDNFVYKVVIDFLDSDIPRLAERNHLGTVLFTHLTSPSMKLVLFMIYTWVETSRCLFLDDTNQELMKTRYAPLVTLICKLDPRSFRLLLNKIDSQFVGSAILDHKKRLETLELHSVLYFRDNEHVLFNYTDEITEKAATQLSLFLRANYKEPRQRLPG